VEDNQELTPGAMPVETDSLAAVLATDLLRRYGPVMRSPQIADALGTSIGAIRLARFRRRGNSLPPSAHNIEGRGVAWRTLDVVRWLSGGGSAAAPAPAPAFQHRPGRPRKTGGEA